MPTIFTHAAAAASLGSLYPGGRVPPRFWVLAAACAVLPDADVFGFAFGVRYGHMLGHRGLSHSLPFALLTGAAVATLFFRAGAFSREWWRLAAFFSAATASHGLLDALTDGGLGVAFFAPFDDARYFFPWRPVMVSPIGLGFFSSYGLTVIRSELVWVWLPSALLFVGAFAYRRASGRDDRGSTESRL